MKKCNVNRKAGEEFKIVTKSEFQAICDKAITDSKAIGIRCNYRSKAGLPASIARLSGIDIPFLVVTSQRKYISKKTITILMGRLALEYNTTIW